MKKSIETLLEDFQLLKPDRYDSVQAIRRLVAKQFKPLSEEVKYGGILFSADVMFAGV
jgi:hypothetical protein